MVINILIVENDDLMRRALRECLRPVYPCAAIGDALDCADALKMCRSYLPRLVLLDLNLPDGSGMALIPQIKRLVPLASIVVVSQHAAWACVQPALEAGACAFVAKDTLRHDLLPAVAQALEEDW
jgi:DNA-binding NarL/FixJ family response regulator